MHKNPWPSDADRDGLTVAGSYNAILGGGSGGYSVSDEKELAARVVKASPDTPELARSAMAVMLRATRAAVSDGIEQCLDLGCGAPSPLGMVHHVAQSINSAARTVYVDISKRAAGHVWEQVDPADSYTKAMVADITDVDAVLQAPDVTSTLDFDQPMLILLGLVTHFVLDDAKLTEILRRYHAATALGSRMVITAPCRDIPEPLYTQGQKVMEIYRTAKPPLYWKRRTLEGLKRVLPARESWVPAWELHPHLEPALRPTPDQVRRWGNAMLAVEIHRQQPRSPIEQ